MLTDSQQERRPTMKKEQKMTVKIGCDNTEIMAALDEIEKKIDLITAKLENLGKLSGQVEVREDH
jgi:hypothetical protein